jgi:NAD(P)-dependent dehydrogenase (short-subunit alcohol dehydrogenase family)
MNTIVVTGAHGDIGNAIVGELKKRGDHVIGIVHSTKSAEELRAQFGIETLVADVTECDALLQIAPQLPERIDWLVTAHGYIAASTDPMSLTSEEIERTFNVNALSQIYLAQIFTPRLAHGMVCISSTAGIQPNGKVLAYSASKAAANALMQGLARNVPDKHFIALCPGPTQGRMRARIGAQGGQQPELVAQACCNIIDGTYAVASGDIITIKDGVSLTVGSIAP